MVVILVVDGGDASICSDDGSGADDGDTEGQ